MKTTFHRKVMRVCVSNCVGGGSVDLYLLPFTSRYPMYTNRFFDIHVVLVTFIWMSTDWTSISMNTFAKENPIPRGKEVGQYTMYIYRVHVVPMYHFTVPYPIWCPLLPLLSIASYTLSACWDIHDAQVSPSYLSCVLKKVKQRAILFRYKRY